MQVTPDSLPELAKRLLSERKRQGLTRAQAASVCNVSTSFIRDAEDDPSRCSFALLMKLIQGLGLKLTVEGWQVREVTLSTAPATSDNDSEATGAP
ncbi:MAG: helix-turn-helix domain-containing protein [Rhodoferax sp.]|nr:helix-turn-helix domain-containing protein [Rhodoferax sp.]